MLTILHPLVDFSSVAVLATGGVWWLFRGSDLPSRLSSPVLTRLFIRQPWVCWLSV